MKLRQDWRKRLLFVLAILFELFVFVIIISVSIRDFPPLIIGIIIGWIWYFAFNTILIITILLIIGKPKKVLQKQN